MICIFDFTAMYVCVQFKQNLSSTVHHQNQAAPMVCCGSCGVLLNCKCSKLTVIHRKHAHMVPKHVVGYTVCMWRTDVLQDSLQETAFQGCCLMLRMLYVCLRRLQCLCYGCVTAVLSNMVLTAFCYPGRLAGTWLQPQILQGTPLTPTICCKGPRQCCGHSCGTKAAWQKCS